MSDDFREVTKKMDVISRQAAIDGADAIIARDTSGNNDVVKAMTAWKEYINSLPSAQPEPCENAVSRKAVEEMLKNGFPVGGMWEIEGDVVKQTVCETLADALMDLGKLPSVTPKMRWIPWDSGRLPDDSGMYIVTAYDGTQERVTFAKYQKRLKRWELTGARAYWRVLAWMPLPEPWKGEAK